MRFEAIPYGNGTYFISEVGSVFRLQNGSFKEVNPTITNGYYTIKINGERYYIHKLVAELFVPGKSSSRYKVAHRNGNNLDNRADNLVWATYKEVQESAKYLPEYRKRYWDVDHE